MLPLVRAKLEHHQDQTSKNSTQSGGNHLLRSLEQHIKEEERRKALMWRCRSSVKWLSLGEAPSY
jgi:hypothetical protein